MLLHMFPPLKSNLCVKLQNIIRFKFPSEWRRYSSGQLPAAPNIAKKKWRVIFFGTDDFALRNLQLLHKEMKDGRLISQLCVVTPPPKPQICSVAKFATKENIPLRFWPLPKNEPTENEWDLGIVASFGHLIPQRIIQAFPLGMLNVHASLLPRWRGAAPVIHTIMNGDKETGVTIMRIKPFKFDVGDIVNQATIAVPPDARTPEILQNLSELGASLLLKCLNDLENYLANSRTQPSEGVTLAPKVDSSLSKIDWSSLSAVDIYNRWRALQHLFKLHTTWHGQNVWLNEMRGPVEDADFPLNDPVACSSPGQVVYLKKNKLLFVKCRNGWAPFSRVTVEKKPTMSAVDFSNGYLSKCRESERHFGT